MEDLFQLFIDVILFPTANCNQVHLFIRILCILILILIFLVPGILCLTVGFSMINEGENKGYILLICGIGCIAYPVLEMHEAYRKRNVL